MNEDKVSTAFYTLMRLALSLLNRNADTIKILNLNFKIFIYFFPLNLNLNRLNDCCLLPLISFHLDFMRSHLNEFSTVAPIFVVFLFLTHSKNCLSIRTIILDDNYRLSHIRIISMVWQLTDREIVRKLLKQSTQSFDWNNNSAAINIDCDKLPYICMFRRRQCQIWPLTSISRLYASDCRLCVWDELEVYHWTTEQANFSLILWWIFVVAEKAVCIRWSFQMTRVSSSSSSIIVKRTVCERHSALNGGTLVYLPPH